MWRSDPDETKITGPKTGKKKQIRPDPNQQNSCKPVKWILIRYDAIRILDPHCALLGSESKLPPYKVDPFRSRSLILTTEKLRRNTFFEVKNTVMRIGQILATHTVWYIYWLGHFRYKIEFSKTYTYKASLLYLAV